MSGDGEIDLEYWKDKLVGKLLIRCGTGQVQDPSKEVSEEEIKAGVPRYRIMKPNHAYTMQYKKDRLNVHVRDESDLVIEKVSIG